METRFKTPLIVAAVLAPFFAVALAAGVYTYRAGVVRVAVNERRPGGDNVNLVLPGVVVSAALAMVPRKEFRHNDRELREWLPAVRIAARELDRAPDATLVQVETRSERVNIAKRGSALLVDVVSDEETVHVSVPLALVGQAAGRLEEDTGDMQ